MKKIVIAAALLLSSCTGAVLPTGGGSEDGGDACPAPKENLEMGEICFRLGDECERCVTGFSATKTMTVEVENRDASSGICAQEDRVVLRFYPDGASRRGEAQFRVDDCWASDATLLSGGATEGTDGVTINAEFAPSMATSELDCSSMPEANTERCGGVVRAVSLAARGFAPWSSR